MAVYGEDGFYRAIHNIENSPFRTKFDRDVSEMKGYLGIGCISDYDAATFDSVTPWKLCNHNSRKS